MDCPNNRVELDIANTEASEETRVASRTLFLLDECINFFVVKINSEAKMVTTITVAKAPRPPSKAREVIVRTPNITIDLIPPYNPPNVRAAKRKSKI